MPLVLTHDVRAPGSGVPAREPYADGMPALLVRQGHLHLRRG